MCGSLVSVLLLSALPAVPAQAADDPTLAVTGPPVVAPRTAGPQPDSTYLDLGILATGLAEVHVSVTGEGVRTADPDRDYDTSTGQAFVEVWVGTDPGVHRVDITFTAPGVDPVVRSYDLWAPGGTPLPATGDLAGRWWVRYGEVGETGRQYFSDREVWFLDRTWSFVGVPRAGVPRRCAPDVAGCHRYRWDEQGTGYVEIGDRTIGLVTDQGVWLDLWDDGYGNSVPALFSQRLAPLSTGSRLNGRWHWYRGGGVANGHDLTALGLRLRRSGSYVLTRTRGTGPARATRGTYDVLSRGRIRLSGGNGRTFVPCADQSGHPTPRRCLVMEYRLHSWRGTVLQTGAR